jgi:hypothetical protein
MTNNGFRLPVVGGLGLAGRYGLSVYSVTRQFYLKTPNLEFWGREGYL